MNSMKTDIGNYIKGRHCYMTGTLTAGSTDNVAKTGDSIDRLSNYGMAGSCKVVLQYYATIAASETATVDLTIQDSDDNSNWNTAETLQTNLAVASGLITNVDGLVDCGNYDLSAYKRYIRFNSTVDLSASGTDTIAYSLAAILGGYDTLPQ